MGGVPDRDPSELIHSEGQAHCPNEECEWWVPEGMEYTYRSHRCDVYGNDIFERARDVMFENNWSWEEFVENAVEKFEADEEN